jgi:hypothetical protein
MPWHAIFQPMWLAFATSSFSNPCGLHGASNASRNPGENACSTDGAHVHPLIYDNLAKFLFMIEI